jgi:hypothetical protein
MASMQTGEGLRDQVMQNLRQAIDRLNEDYERVAFWAAALDALVKPIPTYEPTHSEYLLGASGRPQKMS